MKWISLVAISVFLISCGSSNSGSGNEGPGGGDVTAQGVAAIAEDAYEAVRTAPRLFPEVDITKLRAAIQRARILIRPRTEANGVETDATNNGLDLIEINRARWRAISDPDRKLALVFHELLGLMGLERNSYFISNRLLSVKNRFAAETVYDCRVGNHKCQIEMSYDRTIGAFLVEDRGCGNFPSAITTYRRSSSSTYSIHGGGCNEDEESGGGGGPETPIKRCSGSSIGYTAWEAITFRDGYEFFFEGYQDQQLQCALSETAPERLVLFESSTVNSDGSVTYVEPKFRYNSQYLPRRRR